MTATASATLDVAYDHWDRRRRLRARTEALASLEQYMLADEHEKRFERRDRERQLSGQPVK